MFFMYPLDKDGIGCQGYLAKPTPRLTPLASRSIRVEMTCPKGFSMFSSSCSSIETGRLEMYKLVGSCSCCCGQNTQSRTLVKLVYLDQKQDN